MTIQIDHANRLHINNQPTGLALSQTRAGTVVYTPAGVAQKYKEHTMPHARYSVAHDAPSSGAAGRLTLERDVRNLLLRLKGYAEEDRAVQEKLEKEVDYDNQQRAAGNPDWWL